MELNSEDLESALMYISKRLNCKFHSAVVSNDEMQKLKKTIPYVYIQNTDFSFQKGKHWILWACLSPKQIIFFDSFAECPLYYNLIMPNGPRTRIWKSNAVQVQPNSSKLCGVYCLWIAFMLLKGNSFEDAINSFSHTLLNKNDKKMRRFYMSLSFPSIKDRGGRCKQTSCNRLV